jgi:hypothetical protein
VWPVRWAERLPVQSPRQTRRNPAASPLGDMEIGRAGHV